MSITVHVDLVSVERPLFSGSATFVVAPASEGEVGITPRHTPFLSTLRPGEVKIKRRDGEELHFFVTGGLIEVQPDSVTILADTGVQASSADEAQRLTVEERARIAEERARERTLFAKVESGLAKAQGAEAPERPAN